MVAQGGGYFGTPFNGFWGFTQGYPLSLIVFDIVMYAMVWHWVAVVVATESGSGGLRRAVQRMAFFSMLTAASLTPHSQSGCRGSLMS